MKRTVELYTGILIYIILLLVSNAAVAQPYYFRHYQVENGLSNNTVNCSIQDKNGFLWFGTKEGLNRFDGYHFKLYTLGNNEDGAPGNDLIFSLFTDTNGTLWVGSEKGMFRFDEEKEQLIPFIDSLQVISNFQMDNSGQLWFLSWNSVCRYNFTTKTLKQYPSAEYFYATNLCKSADGTMWAATTDGFLQKYHPSTDSFTSYNLFSHSENANSRWLQKVYPAGEHSLFIGTSSQGIKQFNIDSSTYQDILTYNPDKTTVFVRDILKYDENEFWFATESGIFILNTDTRQFTNLKKKFLDPYSLSDNAVYTLTRDSEGGVWAGTFFGGINYYPRQYTSFQKYFPDNSKNSINGSAVREIIEDKNKNLWIGTEDAGLNKLNPVTGEITHFEPTGSKSSISYSNIHGLLALDNDLWIGTFEHGIDVMDLRTEKIKKHYKAGLENKDLNSNFILCFLNSRSGKLYLGSSNGAYIFNKEADNFNYIEGIPRNIFVAALMEDHAGNIWIGTHGRGIFKYDPVTKKTEEFITQSPRKNGLTSNTLNAIFEDNKNRIWFSTEGGGLCKLNEDGSTFTAYTIKQGMPSNFIFKVIQDNNYRLWVSTSKGLVSFDPDNASMIIYTKANGLLNDQFNYSSGYKNSDGTLYFGSIKGMISFNPTKFLPNNFIPAVYITGFQVHNKELPISKDSSFLKKSIIYTDKITLPYDQSSFSIDFTALSFTSPEMTEYRYKMEGLDRDWIYLKTNRKVYFTNLAAGTYVFKVKAATNAVWSKTEKTLTVKVLPPIWATGWAYLLYTILILALLYYLLSTYHKRTQIKKEKEIYEAKLDFFTNIAHEIKTPLTLIKGPVENLLEKVDEVPDIREDVTTMERNTNRLISLITQILDFRQTESKGFSIDFTKENISAILEDAYLNFKPFAKKRNLTYTLDIPADPVYAMADEEALNKIFSNLISNATKYAASQVSIRLHPVKKNDLNFTIEVSNDGYIIPPEMGERIFEPFFRLRETLKQKGTGVGLSLARSLAELHQGNLFLQPSENGLNIFILSLPIIHHLNEQGKIKAKKSSIISF